jgi:hypothetical protein
MRTTGAPSLTLRSDGVAILSRGSTILSCVKFVPQLQFAFAHYKLWSPTWYYTTNRTLATDVQAANIYHYFGRNEKLNQKIH